MSGILICYEGNEGSGKSVNRPYLAEKLREKGLDVVETREPGGTPLAEIIREVLLAPCSEIMHPDTELLLMFASRAQHYNRLVIPALERGAVVISDRWVSSSVAIQGYARGIPLERIETLKNFVLGSFNPAMTILFDLPVEVGAARALKRGKLDRFEVEGTAFFNAVRRGFLEMAQASPERYRMIDASLTLPEVQAQIDALIPEIVALAKR